MTFAPFINGNGNFGLVSDSRPDLDGIIISAHKATETELATLCPPLPAFDRSSEQQAQVEIDAALAVLVEAEQTKTLALKSMDFAKLNKADLDLENAKTELKRVQALKTTLVAILDGAQTKRRHEYNSTGRDINQQLLKDKTAEQESAIADLLEAIGPELTTILIRHQQIINLREQVSNDSIAESFEQASLMPVQIYTPPEPKPEDVAPYCERREASYNALGTCADQKCRGNLCLENDGTGPKGTRVCCERCGKIVENHPILATV